MAKDDSSDDDNPISRPTSSPDSLSFLTESLGEPLYKGKFAMRPSTAVVEALATVMEVELTELPTMYETVDLESLDSLFRDPKLMQRPGSVKFPVNEYTFLVTSDGWIAVWEVGDDAEPELPTE